jgi:hypothetical protein
VYAHFPDHTSLLEACTSHWAHLHPLPDAAAWGGVEPFRERLRVGLTELYAWYGSVERDLVLFLRDAGERPETAAGFAVETRRLVDALAPPADGRVRAAVGHGVDFDAWRSLRRQGLTRRDAVDFMVRLAEGVSTLHS